MNNLDKILEKIEADTRHRINEIHRETEERADALMKQADSTIAGLEREAALQAEKEETALLSRSTAAAAMKCREILLTEKAALVAEVYRQAEAEIMRLPEDEYTALLAGLAAQAVAERVNTVRFLQEEYGDEAFDGELENGYTLLLSAADRDKVGDAVLASALRQIEAVVSDAPTLTLSGEDACITGGVVVRYGDTETTCSIPVILAELRDTLDPMVVKILLLQ